MAWVLGLVLLYAQMNSTLVSGKEWACPLQSLKTTTQEHNDKRIPLFLHKPSPSSSLPPFPSPLLPNSLLPLDKRHDLGPVKQVWRGRLVELCLKLFVKSLPPNTIWKTFEQLKGKEGGREGGRGEREEKKVANTSIIQVMGQC